MGTSEPGQSTRQKDGSWPPNGLRVEVVWRCDAWHGHVSEESLAQAAQAAFAACDGKPDTAELSVLLSDDEEIRTLNREWRGKDGATNVLSFPLGSPPRAGQSQPIGDVALAYETVMREALQQDMPVHQHAVHLIVHGVLHLMGYDHMSEDDAQEMEALETRVLADLGIPDPYTPQVFVNGEGR